jgi:hypothetical protein
MSDAFLSNFALLDRSAYVVITVIVGLLVSAVASTILIRARYHALSRELRRNADGDFASPVLSGIARDTLDAAGRGSLDINTQAIVEQGFQRHLSAALLGERFIKATVGLLIILGLVGTFYGLTLSIGRLVGLVSGDGGVGTADVAQGLTQGLTQALSGMSVAFTCSLFGIVSAILMTLITVFFNVTDARVALMVEIEGYLDNRLLRALAVSEGGGQPGYGGGVGGPAAASLDHIARGLASTVGQLQAAVGQFDAALQNFALTTRDFREFNLHLKDNVQRLSLSFGDLSETLKAHVNALQQRERGRP